MQHLLELLDAEVAGLSVIWHGPDDKKNAAAFRLAAFQDLEFAAGAQNNSGLQSEDPAPVAAASRTVAHVLLQEDILDRVRVAKHPNKRPHNFDEFRLDSRRCRTRE